MSVENGVVFSDCLTLYFVRIPKAGEPFSSNIRDPKLINWLKAFRFPESTSDEEMLRLEETTPELKELRKQMFNLLTTPTQRDYIEGRSRFYTTQRTILKENSEKTKEIATLIGKVGILTDKNATLIDENATLTDEVATLKARNDDMQKLFCNMLVATASERFKKPISEIKALLDGRTQKTLGDAYNLLSSNVDYEKFAETVSQEQ